MLLTEVWFPFIYTNTWVPQHMKRPLKVDFLAGDLRTAQGRESGNPDFELPFLLVEWKGAKPSILPRSAAEGDSHLYLWFPSGLVYAVLS